MKIIILTFTLLAISAYINLFLTTWFIAGVLFGLINLYFIKKILYEILIVNPKNISKIIWLILMKFPLLYGVSFGLLYIFNEISWTLIAGFTLVLAISITRKFCVARTNEKIEAV
jgi:hypothetical protein